MVEQSPRPTPKPHWRESPHLSFDTQSLKIQGDPKTPADFNRALNYLETIIEHFLEFGFEDKTPFDVAYELSYHNAWHQWEVEQERKAGEKTAEYREINLYQLRALSKRRLLAMAETSRGDETGLPVAQFFDQLIEQAIGEEEALNRLRTPTHPEQ